MRLGELISVSKGKKPNTLVDAAGPGYRRALQIQDLREAAQARFCPPSAGEVLAEPSDILLAWDGANAGESSWGLTGSVGSTLARLRICRPADADTAYVGRFLRAMQARLREGRKGATVPHVDRAYLANLDIPLPPLPEQRRIAAILDQADALRTKRRKTLALLDDLTQAVFLDMFGSPERAALRWEMRPAGDLCARLTVGVVVKPASYYVESGVPALRSLNVRPGRIVQENLVYFSEAANSGILAKSRLRAGDVVIVRTGQPGTAAVVPSSLNGANAIDLIVATPNPRVVTADYLVALLNSGHGERLVGSAKVGQVQQHFNVGAFKRALIPVPPLHLQEDFASRLRAVEGQRGRTRLHAEGATRLSESLQAAAFLGSPLAMA